MSIEGPNGHEAEERIKIEVDIIDKRLAAIFDIAGQLKNTKFDDATQDLFEEYDSLSENSKRKEIGYDEVLKKMEIVLQRLREVAVENSLEADLTDQGLDSHWKMMEVEGQELIEKIDSGERSGKSRVGAVVDALTEDKTKH
ncbi:MAG: hypothetical protein ABL917_00810 [Parcubacteria group bacterium]